MPSTQATYITVPNLPGGRALEKPVSAPSKLTRRQAIKSTERFDDKIRHPWEVIFHFLFFFLNELGCDKGPCANSLRTEE